MEKYPDKPKTKPTTTISLRVEIELAKEFERLRKTTSKDIPEAQRIALRECATRLRSETQSGRKN